MAALPEPLSTLSKRLRDIEERVRRLDNRSSFYGTGLTPQADAPVSFQAGMVGNDALADPLVPSAASATATNWAASTSWAEVAGVDLVVPAGATRCLLYANGWCYGVNSSAAADDLHARVSLAATIGQEFLSRVAVAAYDTVSAGLVTLATGLTAGAVLRLSVSAKTTTGAWPASVQNTSNATAMAVWLK
jgi:hypothetical protein